MRALTTHARQRRGSARRAISIERDDALHDQHENDENERPGHCAGHVEDLLLLQQLVTYPAGRAHKLSDDDHPRGIAEIDLPCRENARQ